MRRLIEIEKKSDWRLLERQILQLLHAEFAIMVFLDFFRVFGAPKLHWVYPKDQLGIVRYIIETAGLSPTDCIQIPPSHYFRVRPTFLIEEKAWDRLVLTWYVMV